MDVTGLRTCKQAGPYALYCDRQANHLGWHSHMREGVYYEWIIDRSNGRVVEALRNGDNVDLTAGALPSCPNHPSDQICPDCTS